MGEDDDDMNQEGTSHARVPSTDTYFQNLNTSDFRTTSDLNFIETNLTSLMQRQIVMMNRQVSMHEQTIGGFKSIGKAIKGIGNKLKKLGRSRR